MKFSTLYTNGHRNPLGIRQTILTWVENDGEHIHENYDAVTGEGLCCPYFSRSCTFIMEFVLNF